MMSDTVGVQLSTHVPYTHEIRGHGDWSMGVFTLEQQSYTLGLVFYPGGARTKRVHPYFGFGAVFTQFQLSTHRDLEEDWGIERVYSEREDEWGGYFQTGLDINLTSRLLLSLQARYTHAADEAQFLSYGAGLGYRF